MGRYKNLASFPAVSITPELDMLLSSDIVVWMANGHVSCIIDPTAYWRVDVVHACIVVIGLLWMSRTNTPDFYRNMRLLNARRYYY